MVKRVVLLVLLHVGLSACGGDQGRSVQDEAADTAGAPGAVPRIEASELLIGRDPGDPAEPTAHLDAAAAELLRVLESRDADGRERLRAAMTLGKSGADGIALLVAAMRRGAPDVQLYAITGIGDAGPDAVVAVPALVQVVADERDALRELAIAALGQIGPGAQDALPLLEQLASEGSAAAKRAVDRIRPE